VKIGREDVKGKEEWNDIEIAKANENCLIGRALTIF